MITSPSNNTHINHQIISRMRYFPFMQLHLHHSLLHITSSAFLHLASRSTYHLHPHFPHHYTSQIFHIISITHPSYTELISLQLHIQLPRTPSYGGPRPLSPTPPHHRILS